MATMSDSAKVGAATARRGLEANTASAGQQTRTQAVRGRLTTSSPTQNEFSRENIKASATEMAVKGGPVIFWLVAGIAIVKDIIDIFVTLIDALGIALTATAVGAVVGIPLAFFAEIIDKVAGLFIDFTLVAYFGYIGGGFALRLVIISIGAILDAVPFMAVLPLTTLSFFAAYLMGRGAKAAVKVSGIAQKTGQIAGKVAKYI